MCVWERKKEREREREDISEWNNKLVNQMQIFHIIHSLKVNFIQIVYEF